MKELAALTPVVADETVEPSPLLAAAVAVECAAVSLYAAAAVG
jgi:hypothetical protein